MKRLLTPAIALVALAALAMPASADAKTEAYVQKNASEVLASLNDPSLNADERTKKFNAYMDEFTDMESVANFAIANYTRRFTPEELAAYHKAFREYALAVYENQLDDYRGEAVVVKDSFDKSSTDSVVNTVIRRQDGKDMNVRWRVLNKNGKYQVVDVGLNLDGNLIWLAIEQRAQFRALLDRTNGSAEQLIAKIKDMTQKQLYEKRTGSRPS